MKAFHSLLTTSTFLSIPLLGEQVIEVSNQSTEIPLVSESIPLLIEQWSDDANISILAHDKASVIVVIEEFDARNDDKDTASVRFDDKSGRLRVNLRGDLDESDLTYFVPVNTSAELKCSDGDIRIEGINGNIEISADDGDIELKEIGGSIVAKASNGDIIISRISGSLVAHSEDGDVEVALGQEDRLTIASLASEDGDIDLELPADFNGTLAASTADGDFSSDFPIDMSAPSKGSTLKKGLFKVAGRIGPPGPDDAQLAMATSDGNITIRKQDSH
ncbi:MAG: DUF4097 family beta strand repeat-containing protein [Opitutales bacterium]|nr:DUF4097 family beta strand repeat-containing protein [Opitutales bacterium]